VPLAIASPTATVQGYKMRDEGYGRYEYEDIRDHDGGIRTAVEAWFADPAAAKAKYGPIASWDTSGITDMHALFYNREDFNEDISRWNVSNVMNMDWMFRFVTSFNGDLSCWDVGQVQYMNGTFAGATSFDRQLGGAWATSTANKNYMFGKSPGTIAGKTKQANGTIA
jgi:surface protein